MALNKSDWGMFCIPGIASMDDVKKLKDMGLGKGGSLENALVVKNNSLMNKEGLRNEKEFVNHKILDCMGDLSVSYTHLTLPTKA